MWGLDGLCLGLVLALQVSSALGKLVLLVPPPLQDWDGDLLSLVDQLLTDKDDGKLDRELAETGSVISTGVPWLVLPEYDVVGNVALEECDVDQGRVEVDKVEQEPLDNQRV